jgi:hypothetical protein
MYHGPWLQMSIEQLEHLVHASTDNGRPYPYEKSVACNVLRIRRAVDEATDLAVRAASGYASAPAQFSGIAAGKGVMSGAAALGLTLGNKGPPVKLSRERQFRMREMATQKLAEAYRLDEIATSVATMQSASTLDELAQHVLQRNPNDPDALFAYFFHERIPTRRVAEYTSLESLDNLIQDGQHVASALRTRAVTKMFKDDYEGAVQDLTAGLRETRYLAPAHGENTTGAKPDMEYKIDLQRSLESQMFFYRANTYLRLASRQIQEALDLWEIVRTGTSSHSDTRPNDASTISKVLAGSKHIEVRKSIKANARRALRDYLSFLSFFEYAPRSPVPSKSSAPDLSRDTSIYKVSDMFASAPPPEELPKYPPDTLDELVEYPDVSSNNSEHSSNFGDTFECVTFHPLLPEALCSLLLSHAILQTSPTELRRHSHMAARMIRLSTGLPIFSMGRAGSGADWDEVLESTDNYLDLPYSWTALCGARRMSSIDDDDPGPRNAVGKATKPLKHSSDKNGHSINTRRFPVGKNADEMVFSTARAEAIARWVKESPLSVEGEVTKTKKGGKKRNKKSESMLGMDAVATGGAVIDGVTEVSRAIEKMTIVQD